MKPTIVWLLGAALVFAQSGRPSYAEPSVGPDCGEIAFVSGEDIWTVPLAGGEARLLISHPANESRPLFSPDGKRIAFTSSGTGNGDVHILELATGALNRLTFSEAPERAVGWSRNGKYVHFTSSVTDIAGMGDILRVPAEGGTPMT
jgi:Tol biopolymer transport system component